MRRHRLLIVALVLGGLTSLMVSQALGDQQLTAIPRDQYGTKTITIAQGQSVTFYNDDIDSHNVTAVANGPDGKPLFASATIGLGQTATVAGTQYLTTGTYTFHCTIHPFMQGTLIVTSAGAPVPRPSSGTGSSTGTSHTGTRPKHHARCKRHRHHKRRCRRHRHRRR